MYRDKIVTFIHSIGRFMSIHADQRNEDKTAERADTERTRFCVCVCARAISMRDDCHASNESNATRAHTHNVAQQVLTVRRARMQ